MALGFNIIKNNKNRSNLRGFGKSLTIVQRTGPSGLWVVPSQVCTFHILLTSVKRKVEWKLVAFEQKITL